MIGLPSNGNILSNLNYFTVRVIIKIGFPLIHIWKKRTVHFLIVKNRKHVLSFQLKISGLRIPFTCECDLSILKFLISEDSDFYIKKEKEADSNYLSLLESLKNRCVAFMS
jgi:hypothetical protein